MSDMEDSHIKEVQKNIRNVTKKLNATAKVDSIIAANPSVSLDELLATKRINADQKAQALKKPALQASLAQLEEQLSQLRKIDADYEARLQSELTELKRTHLEEIERLTASNADRSQASSRTSLRKSLLVFSQFLRAAAAKRLVDTEVDTDDSKAFEGALLLVYGGDERAVDAAENLINGSDDRVVSVEGQPLSVTYAQVKKLATEHAAETTDAEEDGSDPTIAHAGLTEVDDVKDYYGAAAPASTSEGLGPAIQGSSGDDMANVQGSTAVEQGNDLEDSFEMVQRPRDETENPHERAQQQQTTSWADDAAAAATDKPVASNAAPTTDDGFHEVERRRAGRPSGQRNGRDGGERGRGRGRGGRRGPGAGSEGGGRHGQHGRSEQGPSTNGERRGHGHGHGRGNGHANGTGNGHGDTTGQGGHGRAGRSSIQQKPPTVS